MTTQTPDTQTTSTGRTLTPAPFLPVQAPTAILIDLFPAEVTLPPTTTTPDTELSDTISKSRLIVTADPDSLAPNHLYVFADSTIGPAIVYSTPLPDSAAARTGSNREGTITAPEGSITFTKSGSCGCGSALKSFAPFSNPYSVA